MKGAVDAEIRVERQLAGYSSAVTFGKNKDGKSDITFAATLRPIIVGQDEDGDDVDTLVVHSINEGSWRAVRRGAAQGIERGAAQAGKALFVGGVAMLMHVLGSDIAALAAAVSPYVPFHDMLDRMFRAPPETAAPDSVPADEGGDVRGQLPRAPVPREPKTRSSPAKTRAQNRTQS